VPAQTIGNTYLDGFQFSDNSFLKIILNYGFIVFFLFFLFFIKNFRDTNNKKSYLLFLFFSSSITNSILWDFFLMTATLIMVMKNSDIEIKGKLKN